jgi:hypothetical protein
MKSPQSPIIFLDHDGVICLRRNWGSRFKKAVGWAKEHGIGLAGFYERADLPVGVLFDDFDQKAVGVLNRIISETGADIIVSSDWRLQADLPTLQRFYLEQGVVKGPIGMTGICRDAQFEEARVKEIQGWLEQSPHSLWVAVDDMNLGALGRFVHTTRSREGIKQSGVAEKIIGLLKEP